MDILKQVENLEKQKTSFKEKLIEVNKFPLKTSSIDILQLNIIRKCNLFCKHCHVQAGPNRTEIMSKEILKKSLDILNKSDISTLDITGGAPEMNPHLEWFLTEASNLGKRIIVRSNLVILKNDNYKKFLDIYTKNKIEICASLPDYTKERSEKQRGCGIFDDSIEIIRELNKRGYGKKDTGLILDMVHNPVGAYLPGSQTALQHEYKTRLKDKFNIDFNNLFSITNMPLGRYLEYLIRTDNFEDYMNELINTFNPNAADNVMCKVTLSIAWDGKIYNCDFNQILCMPINKPGLENILNIDIKKLNDIEIILHNHCFGCTAGSGSSCQGATA